MSQTEIAECGLACLAMICAYHGHDVDLATLRRRHATSLRGATLKAVMAMGERLNLSGRPVRLSVGELSRLALPAILHWDMNHFVVLEAIDGKGAMIHDPAGQPSRMSLEEVARHFTGVALELSPEPGFDVRRERDELKLGSLLHGVARARSSLIQAVAISVLLQLLLLASPYYLQVAIDQVVPSSDRDLLTVIAAGFATVAIFTALTTYMRAKLLAVIGVGVGFAMSRNLAWRLFRLPVDWFQRRNVGDVISRFQSMRPINDFLTQNAPASLVDGLLCLVVLAAMTYYSPSLTLLAVGATIVYAAVRLIIVGRERAAQEAVIAASAREQTTLIETVRGISTVRMFSKEGDRHSVWQNRLMDVSNASLRAAEYRTIQQTSNSAIFGFETVASGFLAINALMTGGFSTGMLFAFLAYKTMYIARAGAFVDQCIQLRLLKLHLRRIADIALAPEDRSVAAGGISEVVSAGAIEIKDVGFRYSDHDPLVLRGVSLSIRAGEHVAITGASGSGKSTLVKLLLGLSTPTYGEIVVDDTPLGKADLASYRASVAGILQSDDLFTGSLVDNIALFEEQPNMARLIACAKMAAIHGDIMAMPMAYETFVGDMGSTLSGGQKQRVLLARALYRQPKILVIDEGTSHLDPQTERAVNSAVALMGVTRVVIAHRAETVSAAERVVRMKDGLIVADEAFSAPAMGILEHADEECD